MVKKKKKDTFEKKTFKNVDEALSFLEKKERQKQIKSQAKELLQTLKAKPLPGALGQIAQQREVAARRQKSIGILGSRAEQLEIEMVSIDEVPMLNDLEKQRARSASPPNRFIIDFEKRVTDSFPQ